MNKLNISKILDTLALIAIVIVFALYIFKKLPPVYLSVSLICIAILKMFAAMIKANHFAKLYNENKQEKEILQEKISYLENEIKELKNK